VELTHDLLTGVIRQQRDLRREQTAAAREAEARAQAERERAERAEAEAARERAEREAQTALAREANERERAARRQVRRTRIALAATAAALVIALGAIGVAVREGRLADARAEEAAHNYELALAAARGNVDFVDSHYKTGEIGTEVAKSLLDAASATFTKLPSERESVDATRSRIKLFSKLAETYRTFGDLAAALDAAQTERRLAEPLAEASSDGARDLADSHSQIGAALQAQGNLTGARTEHEAALATLEPDAAKNPSNSDLQHDLSDGHINLGDVQRDRGDLAGSQMNYKAGLAIIEQLAAKDPSKALWQNDLATAHGKVGDVLQEQGDLAAAIKEYRTSSAIRMNLATTDPTNAQWQEDLAVNHRRLSFALAAQGDLPGGSPRLRRF
jgi:tetratricopeptide (TPR) repeat protein